MSRIISRRWQVATMVVLASSMACSSSSYRLGRAISRGQADQDAVIRHDELIKQGDAAWQGRDREADLRRAIAAWREAVTIIDTDWRTYGKLAHAYYFLAEAHLGFRAMGNDYPFRSGKVVDHRAAQAYRKTLERGYRAALRGMAARSPEFEARIRAGLDVEDAFKLIKADGAELLYWYVANLARWAQAEGFAALFRQRSRIYAGVDRMLQIAPDVHGGGAHRMAGIYFAAAPSAVGGSKERARRHFGRAVELGPNHLINHVFIAEFLERKSNGRGAYVGRLQRVLNAQDGPAELAPENRLAKRMAKALFGRIKDHQN